MFCLQMQKKAQHIFNTFLSSKASSQVNVEGQSRIGEQILREPHPLMFEKLQDQVNLFAYWHSAKPCNLVTLAPLVLHPLPLFILITHNTRTPLIHTPFTDALQYQNPTTNYIKNAPPYHINTSHFQNPLILITRRPLLL